MENHTLMETWGNDILGYSGKCSCGKLFGVVRTSAAVQSGYKEHREKSGLGPIRTLRRKKPPKFQLKKRSTHG